MDSGYLKSFHLKNEISMKEKFWREKEAPENIMRKLQDLHQEKVAQNSQKGMAILLGRKGNSMKG